MKSIIDYVKYHYQFCENIESFFLTNNLDTNGCYIKSFLAYKYLFEYYFKRKYIISLYEVMAVIDNTDFLFMTNSPVLKNHLIFHHAFKTFWKRHKKGRSEIYIFDTTIRSSILGFVTGVVFSRRSSINNMIQICIILLKRFISFIPIIIKLQCFIRKFE